MDRNISNEDIVKTIYKSRRTIYQWVKKNSGSRQDAEDVFQESLIIYLSNLDQGKISRTSEPMPLFTTICKRFWLGLIRKRKIQVVPVENVSIAEDLQQGIDLAVEKERNLHASSDALSQLGEKCQALLKMFYFQKMDLSSIAEKLGFRNEHVARSMKYKCIEKARLIITNSKNHE